MGVSQQNQVRNEDEIVKNVLVPVLTKCCAVAGFDENTLLNVILPLISTTSESHLFCYYQSILYLLDIPDGIVPGFKKLLTFVVGQLELDLVNSTPSLIGLTPVELENKIIQFSTACFLIEKFSDFAEEAEFTQNIVNLVCRASKLGLSPRAIEPVMLGTSRLVWLGHLLPNQMRVKFLYIRYQKFCFESEIKKFNIYISIGPKTHRNL